jgi:transglutaminase-like putative cysteine protease
MNESYRETVAGQAMIKFSAELSSELKDGFSVRPSHIMPTVKYDVTERGSPALEMGADQAVIETARNDASTDGQKEGMTQFTDAPRQPDETLLTVRVGCDLVYEATAETSFLLDVLPQVEGKQELVGERLTLGSDMTAELIQNSHGNRLLRVLLPPGRTEFRHDALVLTPLAYDQAGIETAATIGPERLPPEVIRYTLPSRYCESDKLSAFAWHTFGNLPPGYPRVRAVSDWVHNNIEYRFGSGHPDLSAMDIYQRRFGVCRDFAHLTVALCRALNLPARYVTGHLPDIGFIDPGSPMDFHAYAEVFLGGRWFAADARFNVPRIGRVKISHGLDAVDCAFGTSYGQVFLSHFEVWAYQVEAGAVALGDPIDLSLRLDGQEEVRRRRPQA